MNEIWTNGGSAGTNLFHSCSNTTVQGFSAILNKRGGFFEYFTLTSERLSDPGSAEWVGEDFIRWLRITMNIIAPTSIRITTLKIPMTNPM